MVAEREPIIRTENLSKKYGNVHAVNNLNLSIMPGTVFGLLGPNGAGKTTIILMLLGLTEPSSGRALVGGYDSTRNPIAVKSITGYLPDNVGFYDELTGRENLEYTAALNGISRKEGQKRIKAALERVGLEKDGDRKVGEYSHGMRQRLGIADLLIKDPQVLILDEPTQGLDPEGAEELLQLITELSKKDGRTILLSSHLLYQVQRICDTVGILVKGNLIACGTLKDLQKQLTGDTVTIEVGAIPFDSKLEQICLETEGVDSVERQADFLALQCSRDVRTELGRKLQEKGYQLQHLRLKGFSLDDIYHRYFRKEEYRDENSA